MTTDTQPEVETRERCTHCPPGARGKRPLLDKSRQCWACHKTPEEWEEEMQAQTSTATVELPESDLTLAADMPEEEAGEITGEAAPESEPTTEGFCRKHDNAPAPVHSACLDEQSPDYEVVCEVACPDWMPPVLHEAMKEPDPPRGRRHLGVVDVETGEPVQLSFTGAEFEYRHPSIDRLSLSGGDEYPTDIFLQLVDTDLGELEAGAIVPRDRPAARGGVQEGRVRRQDDHQP
jgi:hypothetical protein